MRSRLAMGGGPNEMLFSHSDISHAVHSIASGLDVTKWRYRFRFHAYMDDMLNLPNDTYVLALLTPEQLFDRVYREWFGYTKKYPAKLQQIRDVHAASH